MPGKADKQRTFLNSHYTADHRNVFTFEVTSPVSVNPYDGPLVPLPFAHVSNLMSGQGRRFEQSLQIGEHRNSGRRHKRNHYRRDEERHSHHSKPHAQLKDSNPFAGQLTGFDATQVDPA
jgi:hypothetical protein